MNGSALLGPWIRRFLLEHLVSERNLAKNTQRSYRDTLRLLLPSAAQRLKKSVDQLQVVDISADLVRSFLQSLEEKRNCRVSTRNQRLAAIHALARFVGVNSPEHVHWCGQICSVPFKRAPQTGITYLEKPEMDAILASPDRGTLQGRRDYALLLFLYNTGARADEAAQVRISDLQLSPPTGRAVSLVLIHGKGSKMRRCPLWANTTRELTLLTANRQPDENVFLNCRGNPLTRFGIHTLVERHARKAAERVSTLMRKQVSPHTIRHTTATHLLRAGVDINTIRAWLGHASLTTTNIYAEVDMEMKARALATCQAGEPNPVRAWKEDADLIQFLQNL
jgi:site-specific recombinase XerD